MGSAICVQLRGLICRTSYFEPEDVLRHQSINIFEVVWILDFKFPGGQVAFGCLWLPLVRCLKGVLDKQQQSLPECLPTGS